jgi:hypothetical protein
MIMNEAGFRAYECRDCQFVQIERERDVGLADRASKRR